MDLITYYQVAISVLATLAILMLLTSIFLMIVFIIYFRRFWIRINHLLDIVHRTVEDFESFTERSIDSIEYYKQKYLSLINFKNFITAFIKLLFNNKKKGADYG